jgi:hypothetical protein
LLAIFWPQGFLEAEWQEESAKNEGKNGDMIAKNQVKEAAQVNRDLIKLEGHLRKAYEFLNCLKHPKEGEAARQAVLIFVQMLLTLALLGLAVWLVWTRAVKVREVLRNAQNPAYGTERTVSLNVPLVAGVILTLLFILTVLWNSVSVVRRPAVLSRKEAGGPRKS